jgi:hypothetical protein
VVAARFKAFDHGEVGLGLAHHGTDMNH